MPKFNSQTKTAVKAALEAGKVLNRYFQKSINVDFKGRIDPVTIADKLAQKKTYEIIHKAFPIHSFIGEENVTKFDNPGDYCWVVDPLDGTVNFIHDQRLFCVSVALQYKGKSISGVVHCPALGETFIAEKGKGAWLNGKKIQVSSKNKLIRSLVVTGFPYQMTNENRVFNNFVNIVRSSQGLRRLGSAAIDLAYVACGRFEAFWEEGLHPWDIAAGTLLVEEAGGKVTDFIGKSSYMKKRQMLATNKLVHRQMLSKIDE